MAGPLKKIFFICGFPKHKIDSFFLTQMNVPPEAGVFERYMGLHIAVKVSGLTSVTDEDFMVSGLK